MSYLTYCQVIFSKTVHEEKNYGVGSSSTIPQYSFIGQAKPLKTAKAARKPPRIVRSKTHEEFSQIINDHAGIVKGK